MIPRFVNKVFSFEDLICYSTNMQITAEKTAQINNQ